MTSAVYKHYTLVHKTNGHWQSMLRFYASQEVNMATNIALIVRTNDDEESSETFIIICSIDCVKL